jgi:hypothetical protein
MAEHSRWIRDRRWPFQEIQGITVVVVPARRELHELDEAATVLWRRLATAADADDLAAALQEEFEVGAGEAVRDAREFLSELEGKGLVVRA